MATMAGAAWATATTAPPVVLRRRGRCCTASSSASLALSSMGVWGSLSLSPGMPGLLALPRRREPPAAAARLRLLPPRAALFEPPPGGCLKRDVPARTTYTWAVETLKFRLRQKRQLFNLQASSQKGCSV